MSLNKNKYLEYIDPKPKEITLVKTNYPKYDRLRRICIQRSENDKMQPFDSIGGVTILHYDPKPHWILASRLEKQINIWVYDSLGITFNPLIKRSVAELFARDTNTLNVQFKPCVKWC